jgi:hypothetical protein
VRIPAELHCIGNYLSNESFKTYQVVCYMSKTLFCFLVVVVVLEFELWASHLLGRQALFHLSHKTSPKTFL